MTSTAPILLFTYKRLDTLKKTVSALLQNRFASESELFVFSDGARREEDRPVVEEVRNFIKTISGFQRVHFMESPVNKGLATSIINGVNTVLQTHDRVIVLEDDLTVSPNFLSFMNTSLDKYADIPAVFSISGYSFNLGTLSYDQQDAYFLNRGWSWGWATWRDRWQNVDWNVSDYQEFSKDGSARRKFAEGGSDLNAMLDKQMNGKLDSWAIRWFYHQYKIDGLTLYPVHSKVLNNGFDQMATHTSGSGKRYLPSFDRKGNHTFNLPDEISIHRKYQQRFRRKMGIGARIVSKVETIFKRIFK